MLALSVPPAEAALITIEITAEVDSVVDDAGLLQGKISVDDTITGHYIYDSTTPDSKPAHNGDGDYWHNSSPYGIFLSVGGFVFQNDPDNIRFVIEIRNDDLALGGDRYLAWSPSNLPVYDDVYVYDIWCEFFDPTYNVLSSDGLPTEPPVLGDWQRHILRINGHTLDAAGRILDSFDISSNVVSVVPEPTTFLFLIFGVFVLRKQIHSLN